MATTVPRKLTTFLMFDGKAEDAMTFCMSLFEDSEIDRLDAAVGDGGQAHMPLGTYGFSAKSGWIAGMSPLCGIVFV